ncbi:MAG: YdcF family protein [Elainellaceae cyanobacterium]
MPDLTSIWRTFNWGLFNWVDSPELFIPVVLVFLALTLISRKSGSTKLSGVLLFILIFYLFLSTHVAATLLTKPLTYFVPKSHLHKVDEVVVLSRDRKLGFSRYNLAVHLWQENLASKVFVTGYKQIIYTIDFLKEKNIPLAILGGSGCSRTTYEEAISTAFLLKLEGENSIILMTDELHMLRASLTFSSLGFEVLPYTAPIPATFSSLDRSLMAVREYFGLASYALLGRFSYQELDYIKGLRELNIDSSECLVEWLPRYRSSVYIHRFNSKIYASRA